MSQDFILFNEIPGVAGNIGEITLNRPAALNALTREMCVALTHQLTQWATATHIKAVFIRATPGRAFCAGGDVRAIYHALISHQESEAKRFFRDEYQMNQAIFHFPKPYIALLDGITFGGGAGVSFHGTHRITTDQFTFAMPETGIGLFPDVGASYFLSRCPGSLGLYLGLTGAHVNAEDTQYAGLTDVHIAREQSDAVIAQLAHTPFNAEPNETVTQILAPFNQPTQQHSSLKQHRALIDRCFSKDTLSAIFSALKTDADDTGRTLLETLLQRSPTSLKATLGAYLTAKQLDFDACMQMEYRLTCHFLHVPDFREGVRAVLIDKDHSPKWSPARVEDENDTLIHQFFTRDR